MLLLVQGKQQIFLHKSLEALWDALTCVYPQYYCHPWEAQQQAVAAVAVLDESLLRRFREVQPQSSQAYDLEMVETEVELSLSQTTVEVTVQQAFREGIL